MKAPGYHPTRQQREAITRLDSEGWRLVLRDQLLDGGIVLSAHHKDDFERRQFSITPSGQVR